ncbi:MAG: CinA family protein [Deltaproteobacteria bacterium]
MKRKETAAETIGRLMRKFGLTLAVGESCTGGLVCHKITNISGSSKYFRGGVIAYNNDIKEQALGVSEETLKRFGAVSKETAITMARGAKKKLGCDIGLSVTGIAGPTGGSRTKPVGTVFTAISGKTREENKRFLFKGTRQAIKLKASNMALNMLKDFLLNGRR